MLKELGITHIVSMGESALLPPRPQQKSFKRTNPTNSLWLEERMGNIKVLDLANIADDGIDSLGPFLKPTADFMAQARASGGRILVHCRVGVSRSASIVIAYLMRELELDLASAYLLCRSRRLNILIQPNLPFMMSLHGLEIELIRNKEARLGVRRVEEEGAVGEAGLKRSNRVTWSYFCTELAKLNERFLC
jgi:dual specificity MAP kinase phosphatase